MFNFNLKKAAIFQAVKWSKYPLFKYIKIFKKLFLFIFIIAFFIFLYGFFSGSFSQGLNRRLLGAAIIFLILYFTTSLKESFFSSKLKKPKLKVKIEEVFLRPKEFNLAEFLSFEVSRAVNSSLNFAKAEHIPEVNSTLLFYFLLKDNPKLDFVFFRALLNLNNVKEIFKKDIFNLPKAVFNEQYSLDFQNSILEAFQIAAKKDHKRIEIGDILTALAKNNQTFKEILINANLKVEDIENLTCWLEDLEKRINENKKFWERKNLLKKGSFAKDWAAGYTILLDQFSINVTELMRKKGFREIFAHKKEVETMETILARAEKNNVLIVGESGSARRSMIEALANQCALGESLPELNYKRVIILDLPKVLAATENIEEAEETLDKIFTEAVYAGNVILVIDNIDNYINVLTERRAGIVEISGTLSSYLILPHFKFIGITTFEGLHRNIEQNSALLSLFEKVEVSEISEEETLLILEDRALRLEGKYAGFDVLRFQPKYKIFVSYPAIRDIVSLAARYLPALPFPEKAMQLLDEAMVYVAKKKKKIVLPEDIAKIITGKTQIPVGELQEKEKELLLNLEKLIHKRIINQDEAVKEVSSALRRARSEVTIRKGPIGCFLFLGPTGVGKTETSKALAEVYFGSENRMIRLDMSEFQAISDIPRLIGSPGQEGLLTTRVRENPFSLILLDELEKAHFNILNLFLQVFDEGHLTDGMGRKVDFKNSIIIATSNAGSELIWKDIKSDKRLDTIKDDLLDYLFQKGIFRPEFINRFDAVVIFKPLTKENLILISELLLQNLKKNLKEKGIDFVITEPLKEKITELGYSPTFGAREMRRVIQDKVENILANAVLAGKIKSGDKLKVDPQKFELIKV